MVLRLYKFLNEKYALQAIKDARIKISRISELNDPFEFLTLALEDKDSRQALRRTKRDISETTGLICMSKKWSNPLLWSHYSDRHRGICLGFDVSYKFFEPVHYRAYLLTLEELGVDCIEELNSDHMKKIILCKYDNWKYEDEYRAWTDINEIDGAGIAFREFDDDLVLKEIILGSNNRLKRSELESAVKAYPQEITLRKARAAFKKFAVVEQKNAARW